MLFNVFVRLVRSARTTVPRSPFVLVLEACMGIENFAQYIQSSICRSNSLLRPCHTIPRLRLLSGRHRCSAILSLTYSGQTVVVVIQRPDLCFPLHSVSLVQRTWLCANLGVPIPDECRRCYRQYHFPAARHHGRSGRVQGVLHCEMRGQERKATRRAPRGVEHRRCHRVRCHPSTSVCRHFGHRASTVVRAYVCCCVPALTPWTRCH